MLPSVLGRLDLHNGTLISLQAGRALMLGRAHASLQIAPQVSRYCLLQQITYEESMH